MTQKKITLDRKKTVYEITINYPAEIRQTGAKITDETFFELATETPKEKNEHYTETS